MPGDHVGGVVVDLVRAALARAYHGLLIFRWIDLLAGALIKLRFDIFLKQLAENRAVQVVLIEQQVRIVRLDEMAVHHARDDARHDEVGVVVAVELHAVLCGASAQKRVEIDCAGGR